MKKNMKKCFIIIFLLLLVQLAITGETIPPYHWSWNYLDYLKSAGYLPELDMTNRPWTREEVAHALLEMDESALTDKPEIRRIQRILETEFKYEIDHLQEEPEIVRKFTENLLDNYPSPELNTGVFGQALYGNENTDFEEKSDFRLHPRGLLRFGTGSELYANFRIFKEAPPEYIGKEFRNLYAYLEQGYFSYRLPWIRIKLGRDFLQTGAGRTGQLLISDNSRPFDMYHLRIGTNTISFSFFGIQLNKRSISDSLQRTYAPNSNRFLNGHRVSFNWRNKYFFNLSEVVVYGGPNAGWELAFINPLGIYYEVTSNGPSLNANFLYSLDWDLYLPYSTELYGEVLIDDIQVDKKTPGDLEPNEIGLLAGINWADPLKITGSLLNVEYVQVRNRTYNAPVNDWEKYLHRNQVIGYYLGNDFKLFRTGIEKWWRADLQSKIIFRNIRKGEGSVAGEFNTDYLNYTVKEGYDEPFPWGVVETQNQLGIQIFYRPHRLVNFTMEFAYNEFKNYQNVEGQSKSEVSFRMGLWLQWSRWWK